MEELVRMVSEKTGIPQSTAQQAVSVVLNYLKDRLPEPIAGYLDTAAGGKSVGSDALSGLGGLFGKK